MTAIEGHNSDAMLKEFGSRINNLMDQQDAIGDDIKDVLTEAKEKGISASALKKAVKRLRETEDQKQKRQDLEDEVALYAEKLGGFADTPLGKATLENALRA